MDTFIILILAHFISDYFFHPTWWGMQNHSGMKSWRPNLFHSIQYAVIFLPVFYFLHINMLWALYLVATHFVIDTYIPLRLWNKHIRNAINKRKIPKNEPPASVWHVEDQIIHILLLIPLL
jgi:hypothetical protein